VKKESGKRNDEKVLDFYFKLEGQDGGGRKKGDHRSSDS